MFNGLLPFLSFSFHSLQFTDAGAVRCGAVCVYMYMYAMDEVSEEKNGDNTGLNEERPKPESGR